MTTQTLGESVEELKKIGIAVVEGSRVKNPASKTVAQTATEIWLPVWAKQSYQNFRIVQASYGVRFLAGSCKGLPAFIVGVGPSLDDQIKDLKEAVGRAVIISTDAAFRTLMANGIRPDIVISFDCKAQQKLLWENCPPHNVPMLFDSCTHPDSIASWKGPVLFYNHFHLSDQLGETILPIVHPTIGQIPSSGTVGNMAVLLSGVLGCEKHFLVGMDFCYAKRENLGHTVWQYRAKDYRWETNKGEGIPDAWAPTEVKELYDSADRVKRAFDVTVKGVTFKMDPELDFYHESLVAIINHFKLTAVNCAPEGRLSLDIPSSSVTQAVADFCKTELQGGRHILSHLHKIVPDPRERVPGEMFFK
jgi:uncharacterized Rossmann fold enzyme